MDIHALTCYGFSIQGKFGSLIWDNYLVPRSVLPNTELNTAAIEDPVSDTEWNGSFRIDVTFSL